MVFRELSCGVSRKTLAEYQLRDIENCFLSPHCLELSELADHLPREAAPKLCSPQEHGLLFCIHWSFTSQRSTPPARVAALNLWEATLKLAGHTGGRQPTCGRTPTQELEKCLYIVNLEIPVQGSFWCTPTLLPSSVPPTLCLPLGSFLFVSVGLSHCVAL